jgi:hypothetical protein
MATRGRKPTATVLKLAMGNPGKRKLPRSEPVPVGAPERPKTISGKAALLWDAIIARAHWLTWADGPKSLMWCHLQAEFERSPKDMVASRIAQLRALGSELGLDPASRARLDVSPQADRLDPAEKYFS